MSRNRWSEWTQYRHYVDILHVSRKYPWEFAVCPEIATGGEAALRRAIEQAIEDRVLEAAMRLVDALDLHRALQAPFHAACALCSGGHGSNTQCQRPPAVCRNGQGS